MLAVSLSFDSSDPRIIEVYYGNLNLVTNLLTTVANQGGIRNIPVTFGPTTNGPSTQLTILVRNLDPATPGTTLWTVSGTAVVNLAAPLAVIGGEFTGYNSTPVGRII